MAGARAMLADVAEQRAAYVRTGHHSATSGGVPGRRRLRGGEFPQHTNRADEPQLHVHAGDPEPGPAGRQADEKWRALDGRPLWADRLGIGRVRRTGRAQELAAARACRWSSRRTATASRSAGSARRRWTPTPAAGREDRREAGRAAMRSTSEIYGRPRRTAARCTSCASRSRSSTRAAKRKPARPERTRRQDRAAQRGRAGRVDPQSAERRASSRWIRSTKRSRLRRWSTRARPERAAERGGAGARSSARPSPRCSGRTSTGPARKLDLELPAAARAARRRRPVAYLDGMADDALSGAGRGRERDPDRPGARRDRRGPLGLRKDGTSIYRPPGEARFVTTRAPGHRGVAAVSRPPRPRLAAGHRGRGRGGAGRARTWTPSSGRPCIGPADLQRA